MAFQGILGPPFLSLSFVSWPLQTSSFLCYALPVTMSALPVTMSGITQAQRQMTKASEKWAEINRVFFSLWGGVLLCSRVTWSSWALPVSARHTLRSQVCATRTPSLSSFQAFLRDFVPAAGGWVMPWGFLCVDLIYGIRSLLHLNISSILWSEFLQRHAPADMQLKALPSQFVVYHMHTHTDPHAHTCTHVCTESTDSFHHNHSYSPSILFPQL